MEFPDCFTKAHLQSSFGGVEMSQTWNDLALWEEFLNRSRPSSVVELGTFKGGMAVFLSLQGVSRGFSVTTIDNGAHGAPVELLQKLGATVLSWDLLSEQTVELMRELLISLPKPTVLFCDNGNKPLEWQRFVPLLTEGDYAAVHDWGSEFHEENLKPAPTPFLNQEAESIQSMTRFFKIEF